MAKTEEKIQAIKLRKDGKSIKWIANKLSVSPGSVSIWCRDVELTDKQIRQLEKQARDPFYGGRLKNALKQKQLRIEKTKRLNEEGRVMVGELSKRELFLVGIALYWAEGYKKDNQVGFGSSDPEMILIVVKWLAECFGYSKRDLIFRVTINESHEYRIDEIVNYWSKTLGVESSQFRKPFYQKTKWKKTYENPNEYFGVLRIRVKKSVDFLRKIHGMIAGMKESVSY